MFFDKYIKPYRKAIVAGLAAGTAALYAAMADDVVTAGEYVMIAMAVLGSGTATYAVPNAPKKSPVVKYPR